MSLDSNSIKYLTDAFINLIESPKFWRAITLLFVIATFYFIINYPYLVSALLDAIEQKRTAGILALLSLCAISFFTGYSLAETARAREIEQIKEQIKTDQKHFQALELRADLAEKKAAALRSALTRLFLEATNESRITTKEILLELDRVTEEAEREFRVRKPSIVPIPNGKRITDK